MPTPITDEAFEFLLARAGLTPTDAEKADLKDRRRWYRGDGRAGPKAARHHGRTGADLRLCRGGSVMERDPDDRRGGPADRREGAVAGRADKGLPRPGHRRSTTGCTRFITSPRSGRWPRRGPPRR